jgi:hypothetical protein
MGIKDNFQKNMKKATQGPLKMKFDKLRKKKSKISEDQDHPGKTCEQIHPNQEHGEWLEDKRKGEMEEATTASSAGQYSTPQIWAKNEKNWRPKNDPKFPKFGGPGAKFVKVKKKCSTFPYCNQGDINALELTENVKIKEAIDKVSEKTGKTKKYIKELVKKEIEELIRRGFYKSPVTDPEAGIVGVGKMNTPIGKIYSMGGNKPKYE